MSWYHSGICMNHKIESNIMIHANEVVSKWGRKKNNKVIRTETPDFHDIYI